MQSTDRPARAPTRPAGPRSAVPGWVAPTATGISLAGLGVAAYLTLAHYASGTVTLACSESGVVNCAKVTTSPESVIVGVPVAVLGLVFFASMLAVQHPRAWRSTSPVLRLGRLAGTVVGVGFVCYLVYTELFTLNAICLYCTAVHVLTVVLFALTAVGTALTGTAAGPAEPTGTTPGPAEPTGRRPTRRS